MAILPDAIAPWTAFVINLRFRYFDDERAGIPDGVQRRESRTVQSNNTDTASTVSCGQPKGDYKRVRFGYPMEDFVIRRLARVAFDPAVPSMRGQVMQEAVLKWSGAGCAARGYPRCPTVDQDKPHRRSPNF
jgi:hypothetical protein